MAVPSKVSEMCVPVMNCACGGSAARVPSGSGLVQRDRGTASEGERPTSRPLKALRTSTIVGEMATAGVASRASARMLHRVQAREGRTDVGRAVGDGFWFALPLDEGPFDGLTVSPDVDRKLCSVLFASARPHATKERGRGTHPSRRGGTCCRRCGTCPWSSRPRTAWRGCTARGRASTAGSRGPSSCCAHARQQSFTASATRPGVARNDAETEESVDAPHGLEVHDLDAARANERELGALKVQSCDERRPVGIPPLPTSAKARSRRERRGAAPKNAHEELLVRAEPLWPAAAQAEEPVPSAASAARPLGLADGLERLEDGLFDAGFFRVCAWWREGQVGATAAGSEEGGGNAHR